MFKLKISLFLIFSLLFIFGAFNFGMLNSHSLSNNKDDILLEMPEESEVVHIKEGDAETKNQEQEVNIVKTIEKKESFMPPMDKAQKRIIKKTFGKLITPETSPVENDRFNGFHTGVDWEIFENEMDLDVSVQAICRGNLILKNYVSGYGGVAIQECKIDGNPVTVVYGHIDLKSIEFTKGEMMDAGEIIGNLGDHKSVETDGTRKHLHLGIHKGNSIEFKGYAVSEKDLSNWIDPCLYSICWET